MNQANPQNASFQKKTVLVIEENAAMLNALASRCQAIGLEVQLADNAIAAAELMNQGFPDVIIIDAEMPACEGKSFLQFLEYEESTFDLPAIVLTDPGRTKEVFQARRLMSYYVQKKPDAWERINIFLEELVDIETALTE